MARLNEQGINAVKKAVGVAALTGPTGQKMGQAGKSAKQGTLPAFEGDKMPMGGQLKEVKITATPLTKEPEFSTFKMNTIYKVDGKGYDAKALELAHKKIVSTYGADSDENKAFLSTLGIGNSGYGRLSSPKTFMKPDFRNDAKSYVDTAQVEYSGGDYDRQKQYVDYYKGKTPNTDRGSQEAYVTSLFNKLINQFGVKPTRALSEDREARQKQ